MIIIAVKYCFSDYIWMASFIFAYVTFPLWIYVLSVSVNNSLFPIKLNT